MQQLGERIYRVAHLRGFINMYLLDHHGRFALVDTGIGQRSVQAIERAMQALNKPLNAIEHILITHAHPDHIGGLTALQARLPRARTYAPVLEAPVVRGEQAPIGPQPQQLGRVQRVLARRMSPRPPAPARVDQELHAGDVLNDIFPGLTVVDLPGHSPGQVGFYVPAQRLLIGGDVLSCFPWGLSLPIALFTADMDEAKRSIQKVAAMDVDTLAVGHGHPLTERADHEIEAFLARLAKRGKLPAGMAASQGATGR
jgi:glyoxylase-like metal-dependent hydrolase (beta-lactamase superfamily II)